MTSSNKKTIDIFYTRFDEPISSKYWEIYFHSLPYPMQIKALRYRKWQDQHAYILGKMLLLEGLVKYGFGRNVLSKIEYTYFQRPFLEEPIDFNISHSAGNVVCAIGENINLGIDIEELRNIRFKDFNKVMTPEQLQNIENSRDSLRSFYKLWTIKESIVKADGRGMSIPILELQIQHNSGKYDNKTWYLTQIDFNRDTCSCLASNMQNTELHFTKINFENGIEKSEWTPSL